MLTRKREVVSALARAGVLRGYYGFSDTDDLWMLVGGEIVHLSWMSTPLDEIDGVIRRAIGRRSPRLPDPLDGR
jgi:hypothetical protein